MDRLEVATARSEDAQRLIDNPMFVQAFEDTRKALLEAWASLDSPESEHSKDLHRMVKCLDKVKRCLETHIQTGKLAQKEIDGRRKLFDFKRA